MQTDAIYNPHTMTPETEAQRAIHLSVRVSERLRAAVGAGGNVLELYSQLSKMFTDKTERDEAQRLIELAARIRKKSLDESGRS